MITRIPASVVMALAPAMLIAPASAFSPNSMKIRSSLTTTQLNAIHAAADSEDDAMYLMLKARECANSEECSIDTARDYLREVIHVQSGCAAGTLAGQDLCEDPIFAAETVAALREKIKSTGELKSRNFWDARQQEFEDLAMASMSSDGSGMSPIAALTNAPIKPVYLGLAALWVAAFITMFGQNTGGDVVPFTLEEWKWAFEGGYLGDMVSQSFKHGGLLVGQGTQDVMTPFTPQEWWWAFKDGYLGDMVGHYARHGGLLVSENSGEVTVPFTPQEWVWAIQGGYVGDMVSQFAKNGGLVVSDNSIDAAVPFNAQEWWWAFRGGYLDNMISHYMRNGGL